MATVSIRGVTKRFGAVEVIHGIDLEIAHQEFVVLVGPSGCGKSTMLRMVAGLEDVTSGDIAIDGRVVNRVAPKDRNIAMVFQNYALYPHMTVARNMAFALRAARLPKPEIERRVGEAARILGLSDLLERKPGELSGGQRQRVAMGRAMVRDPAVFLFDEPLSNLDAKLRSAMRTEIKKLHQTVKTTVIYVTHDQVEAMTLADRIVIMRDGRIEQVGSPLAVYQAPVNVFVAGFIGSPAMNMVEAEIGRADGGLAAHWPGGPSLPIPARAAGKLRVGQPVIVGIRPDHVTVIDGPTRLPSSWQSEAEVSVVEPLGSETLVLARFGDYELTAKSDGHVVPRPGERLRFGFDLDHLHLFDRATERSLA
jgi:multiple sugar transport system ATP-binding protein